MHDVAVIGGGPGGYAAAIRVSQLGGRAVLFESEKIGGTCVNRGCIPTKVWHRAAYMLRELANAGDFGVRATVEGIDPGALKARKDGVSGDIRMGMEGLLENNGVEVVRGAAVLKNPREIVADGKNFEAKNIILASGGRTEYPDIEGLEDAILTVNQALELTEFPSSLLVYGGGPVEVEMATFLRLFGCKVYLATPDPRVLPREDHDTSQRIGQAMRESGIELFPRHCLSKVERAGSSFKALLSAGAKERTLEVERVLTASRRPNAEGMGLGGAGVKLDDKGAVSVDEHLRTSVPNVYAAGDCTGGWMLSHASSAMAVTAAENAMGKNGKFPFHLVPRAIWTMPEVGAVGLSEEEAENAGYDVETGGFPFSINGLAMARGEMDGEVKIVYDEKYGEILGVHIVGANASELIGEGVLAMRLECTVAELANGFRAHPTFSESVVDAARDALDWALYLPKR